MTVNGQIFEPSPPYFVEQKHKSKNSLNLAVTALCNSNKAIQDDELDKLQ